MTELQPEHSWLDYFSGGVPTGEFFRLTLESVGKTFQRTSNGMNRTNELCLIGLVSYFEAFCKDHFASILNIEPRFVVALRDAGQDTLIDPAHLLEFRDEWSIRIGFLVAEKFDFGSAQKINALYGALLKISPFGKDEAKYYASILRDRNLLVHHGGTITLAYAKQSEALGSVLSRPFFDSLVVEAPYFDERLVFIEKIAKKF